jgi:beta-galactosidase
VWTGFDYLGEPTPYKEYWPSRSAYFGIFDLAGLPKDRYWLYRSRWNETSPTLYLLPHWTWPGREGKVTPVYCYTSYHSAELFVNGRSQGRRTKDPSSRLDRYRLRWNDVVYQPGELKVIAYDANGNVAGERIVRTAGTPMRLAASADKRILKMPSCGDTPDLSFVTVDVVDESGGLCPGSENRLYFKAEGSVAFRAVCNGDPTSIESFVRPTMKAFGGRLVVVVEAVRKGRGRLRITADGLKNAVVEFEVR